MHQSLLDAASEGVWAVDGDGQTLYVNNRIASILETTPTDLASRSLVDFVADPQRQATLFAEAAASHRRGESAQAEVQLRTARGATVWTLINSSAITDAGQFFGSLYLVSDINDLKTRQLESSRQRMTVESELAELREAMNLVTEGVVIADAQGNLIDWNAAALRLHGFDSVENLRRHLSEFTNVFVLTRTNGEVVPLEDWPMARLLRGEPVKDYELNVRRTGSDREWTISYTGSVVTHAGKPSGLVVLNLRDLTESRRAERAAAQSDMRFRQLADAMPQIVWSAQPDGRVDYYNERWFEYTGFAREKTIDESWISLLHPDDIQPYLDSWYEAVRARTMYEIECRFLDASTQTYRWHLCRALPIFDQADVSTRWFGTYTDIDALKRAQSALRESEVRLRGVVNTAVDGIITIDELGRIETVNPAVTRIFGFQPDQMVGQNIALLMPAQTPGEYDGGLNNDGRVGERKVIGIGREVIGQRRDGTPFPLELSMGRTEVNGRRIYTGIVRDVTARHESERRLKDQSALLRTLVEGIEDPVYVKGLDGCYRYVNAAFAQLTDRTFDACIGADDVELFGEEAGTPVREMDRRILSSGRPLTYETAATVNRSVRHYLVTKSPFKNADGSIAGLLGVSRDITAHKLAEQALRDGEQHVRHVMNCLLVVVVVLTLDGRVADMNVGGRALLVEKSGADRWQGSPLADFPAFAGFEATRAAVLDGVARAGMGQTVRHDNLSVAQADKVLAFDVSFAPMPDSDGSVRHVILAAADVTDRRLTEERAREQQAEIAHLDRIQTMGHMASGLAHELTQPLGSIANYSSAGRHLIANGRIDAAGVGEILDQVASEALRAGDIIHRLRTFVRKQGPQTQPTDVNALIENALQILAFDIRQAGVEIDWTPNLILPRVTADAVQFSQVMVNLLRNAIDAMETVDQKQRKITIAASEIEDDLVEIRVRDKGVGVAPGNENRLFDTFFTTKAAGLGMGLPLCRMIVENHGGHISARSNAAGGMCFSFTLRAARIGT